MDKLLRYKLRLAKLKSSKKNEDCPGVVRKLERKIRKLESAD